MSRPAPSKRAADAPADDANRVTRRARGEPTPSDQSSAAADAAAPASSSSSAALSPAQRCAADTLAAAFSFLAFEELASVMHVCRGWLGAAAKEKPRERCFYRGNLMAALFSSRSPLRRHISEMDMCDAPQRNLDTLRQLSALPSLTKLGISLKAADLHQLLEERGSQQAVADLGAAFPPRLRSLSLWFYNEHSAAVGQLLVDALPALAGLTELTLAAGSCDETAFASLSLEALLRLPLLADLTLCVDDTDVTVAHLVNIVQLDSLRQLEVTVEWSAESLAALCRPPQRLQRLQRLNLSAAKVGEAAMAELVHLPSLTELKASQLLPAAYPLLAQLPLLRELHISLHDYSGSAVSQSEREAMDDGLRRCTSLTAVHARVGALNESDGVRLLRSLPLLRELHFIDASLPSLEFLRHAPLLEELGFSNCHQLRPAHLALLGRLVPRLTDLYIWRCTGVELDAFERRAMSALLPQLRKLTFQSR
jgi:hypothetical protein